MLERWLSSVIIRSRLLFTPPRWTCLYGIFVCLKSYSGLRGSRYFEVAFCGMFFV